jgi:4-amino-4-deoxy-L-arabinose transferase-like glycosyltransferase
MSDAAHAQPLAAPRGSRVQRFLADRQAMLAWGGGVLSLAIGAVLFTRFSIDGNLWRDEAIYAYGGQQLADGVPVYLGIFDPKPPLPTFLTALGALAGKATGKDELIAMRAEFFVWGLLAVVAVYWVGLKLWRSPLAALAGAVVFASFKGFAQDALPGPDAKTPGIFLMVLALGLLVSRRWFLAGIAGSLAFLDWQPLGICAAAAVIAAVLVAGEEPRWRRGAVALGGVAAPIVATVLFLAIDGGLPQFIEASFTFPATGLKRGDVTLGGNIRQIDTIVNQHYGDTRVLFWGGLVLLVAVLGAWLVRRRVAPERVLPAAVVLGTFAAFAAASVADFQGYPDLYPLLPYAALGIGAAVAAIAPRVSGVGARRAAAAIALSGVVLLVALSFHWYSGRQPGPSLQTERGYARTLNRLLDPGERLYVLGDPTPLVLTKRRNPVRWIYLGSGVDRWAIKHDFGSLAGWQANIRAVDPPVVIFNLWTSGKGQQMRAWLRSEYGTGKFLGHWRVFAKPEIRARARARGIKL